MDNDKYIGRLLDNRYEIQEVIGVGGMAVVYRARCHRLNRLVAIKILKDEFSKDEEFRRRFHAEGQAVAMLSHPNIVSVYDVSTTDEADYIVMELIDGISLKQYMEKKGVLNWKETLHFAIQISKALEHAHSRGIVHRDIKPHNVMVLKNGSVKVADFGIARVMSKSNTLTKEALGSVHYISPEQAKGGRVDNRSDIYSLGTVMYEMMTGRPPYDGESPVAVAIQHINGGARMPSILNPNIPGGLEQIIMKAMAHDPAARYATATAMLYDMDEFRKQPAILFDYNTPPTEEVTKLHTNDPASPKTTAEKVAAAAPEQPVRRRQPAQRGVPAGRVQKPRKPQPKVVEYEEEEERSKVATIAVVACSLVAIVAIVIFLIAIMNGGVGGSSQLVMVPTLVGKNYDTLQISNDLVLGEPQYAHNDTYEKGRVMEQSPKPGDKVAKGTEITVVVSLGPVPQAKTMEDLVGQKQTTAENFLKGQGVLFLCEEETSETVEAGRVIRTEPEAGYPLSAGQTVTLFVSTGPSSKTGVMPDIVNQSLETAKKILERQGLNLEIIEIEEQNDDVEENYIIRTEPVAKEELETAQIVTLYVSTGPQKAKMINVVGEDLQTAIKMLNVAGFSNISAETYVESTKPKDQVLMQSVNAGEEVAINTQIILQLSKGPVEVEKTKLVKFTLLEDMVQDYELVVKDETGKEVAKRTISSSDSSVELTLTGKGVQIYELYINGIYFSTQKVNFND